VIKSCWISGEGLRRESWCKLEAAVAVAHSILTVAWHLLTQDCDYHDLGGDYFIKRDGTRQKDRLVRQLQELWVLRHSGGSPRGVGGFTFQDDSPFSRQLRVGIRLRLSSARSAPPQGPPPGGKYYAAMYHNRQGKGPPWGAGDMHLLNDKTNRADSPNCTEGQPRPIL
jgi:hypothetical protein